MTENIEIVGENGEITFDQVGCARCDGEGHPGITFRPFTSPITGVPQEHPSGTIVGEFTHWSMCPTNGEPLLLWTGEVEVES